MRKLFTLLFIAVSIAAYSAPKKVKLKDNIQGTWNSSNWIPSLPENGDTIEIPATSTLTLGKGENVVLKNVRLEIRGRLILMDNANIELDNTSIVTVFSGGSILGDKNSQKILFKTFKIFEGKKDFILWGPMQAIDDNKGFQSFIEIPMPAPLPLPVKFIGFSAARKNADVLVQWATAQELNADYYEVQRSEDGKNWRAIGSVNAAGTTNNTTTYSYTDLNAAKRTIYYRIKQVDLDDRFEYTAIKVVKSDNTTTEVNAAAVRGNIVLQFSKQAVGQVEVRLVSLNGHVVSRQLLNRPAGQLVIPAAVKGNYILTVSDQQDIQINKQILL